MAGDLTQRRRPGVVARDMQAAMAELAAQSQIEQAGIRATSAVAEFAMSEVTHLKRMQSDLERVCPEASEALALIANTATMAIARSVHRFGESRS